VNAEEIEIGMTSRRAFALDEIDAASLREAGCWERVLVVPENFNERVSYLGNLLVQMLTREIKDDRLRSTVGQLAQSLEYMLNSTSWHDGVLHDFDADELQRKLGRFVKPRS
jgi:hypothetical protein